LFCRQEKRGAPRVAHGTGYVGGDSGFHPGSIQSRQVQSGSIGALARRAAVGRKINRPEGKLDWLANGRARVPKNPEFEKPDLPHQPEHSYLPKHRRWQRIALSFRPTTPSPSSARCAATMLARSCLRSARTFAGARNGAVQFTKVCFCRALGCAIYAIA
jgi:hypothetical protein